MNKFGPIPYNYNLDDTEEWIQKWFLVKQEKQQENSKSTNDSNKESNK